MRKINKLNRKIEYLKYGSFWKSMRTELSKKPLLSFAVAIILLLLGGLISGFVNYISTDDEALMRFIISLGACILILFVGFIIFYPFWNFRKRYNFLDNQEDKIAEKLVTIYKRSRQTVTTVEGINAIQFFRLETHTDDRHLLYQFEKVFSIKSKYFDLSRFKNKKLEFPIFLFDWLKDPVDPPIDYGPLVNGLLYEWMQRRSESELEQKVHFENLIDEWEVGFQVVPKITGLHYHVMFDVKRPIKIELYDPNSQIDSVFVMEYNGDKDGHSNRSYYTLRLYINDPKEGMFEGILLIIANNKRINKTSIKKVMSGILKGE